MAPVRLFKVLQAANDSVSDLVYFTMDQLNMRAMDSINCMLEDLDENVKATEACPVNIIHVKQVNK